VKIQIGAMPISLPDGKREFAVQFADPGVVRAVAWTVEQRLVLARGEPEFGEVLTLFVEFSPGATMRTRRFLVLDTNQGVTTPDGHELAFIATAISQRTGATAHVYEIREVAKRRGVA
jgi:hypothetical protein